MARQARTPPERGSKNGGQGVVLVVAGSPLRSDRLAEPGMTLTSSAREAGERRVCRSLTVVESKINHLAERQIK